MFKRIRQNQPGPGDPNPGVAAQMSLRTEEEQVDAPRGELSAPREDRPQPAASPGTLSRIAADVKRQVLTPEQETEAKRRRRLLA
ncbi:MAG: hypothetical protein AAGB15_14795, partial [Pseudomonadota bacterium]